MVALPLGVVVISSEQEKTILSLRKVQESGWRTYRDVASLDKPQHRLQDMATKASPTLDPATRDNGLAGVQVNISREPRGSTVITPRATDAINVVFWVTGQLPARPRQGALSKSDKTFVLTAMNWATGPKIARATFKNARATHHYPHR